MDGKTNDFYVDQNADADFSGQGTGSFPAGHGKRTRILLSCAPCRISKLKCDRASPCENCSKRGRITDCIYAPRPTKAIRPARNMSARLRRLEGMIRNMMEGGNTVADNSIWAQSERELLHNVVVDEDRIESTTASSSVADIQHGASQKLNAGRIVTGSRATTYVGATHFMAMLDDIEELKSYFEDPQPASVNNTEDICPDSDLSGMIFGGMSHWKKHEVLALMPQKAVIDCLIMHYFSSNVPSQHTIHRPTFSKQYSDFWRNPSEVDNGWLGVLFSIMAFGVHISSFSAPHKSLQDSTLLKEQQFKRYRSAALWALARNRLTNPNLSMIQAVLLQVESEFLVNRASQSDCWLLSSVCLRLMLRAGLHRDPSKMPNISAFDGEMRRRIWHLAVQLDLIVSFHIGLPSMIHGIPSDTALPRNILDDDFDENSTVLPTSRPDSEYTSMSYPIFKGKLGYIFGQVARLSHALTSPTYSEVMRVDAVLEKEWKKIPEFLKVRPLERCVADPPMQVLQRFGLASLYQKSRCVLHRPYLVEPILRKDHSYSRHACLQAALKLLEYHASIHDVTQPGAPLHQIGWFPTGLAMHDFLLAAMVVYLVVQNSAVFEGELITDDSILPGSRDASERCIDTDGFMGMAMLSSGLSTAAGPSPSTVQTQTMPALPTLCPVSKTFLIGLLLKSHQIWLGVASTNQEVKKAADLLQAMIGKIHEAEQKDGTKQSTCENTANLSDRKGSRIATCENESMGGPLSPLMSPEKLQPELSTPSHVPIEMDHTAEKAHMAPASFQYDPMPDMNPNSATYSGVGNLPVLGYNDQVDDAWMPDTLDSFDWAVIDNELRASSGQSNEAAGQRRVSDINLIFAGLWDQPLDSRAFGGQ